MPTKNSFVLRLLSTKSRCQDYPCVTNDKFSISYRLLRWSANFSSIYCYYNLVPMLCFRL